MASVRVGSDPRKAPLPGSGLTTGGEIDAVVGVDGWCAACRSAAADHVGLHSGVDAGDTAEACLARKKVLSLGAEGVEVLLEEVGALELGELGPRGGFHDVRVRELVLVQETILRYALLAPEDHVDNVTVNVEAAAGGLGADELIWALKMACAATPGLEMQDANLVCRDAKDLLPEEGAPVLFVDGQVVVANFELDNVSQLREAAACEYEPELVEGALTQEEFDKGVHEGVGPDGISKVHAKLGEKELNIVEVSVGPESFVPDHGGAAFGRGDVHEKPHLLETALGTNGQLLAPLFEGVDNIVDAPLAEHDHLVPLQRGHMADLCHDGVERIEVLGAEGVGAAGGVSDAEVAVEPKREDVTALGSVPAYPHAESRGHDGTDGTVEGAADGEEGQDVPWREVTTKLDSKLDVLAKGLDEAEANTHASHAAPDGGKRVTAAHTFRVLSSVVLDLCGVTPRLRLRAVGERVVDDVVVRDDTFHLEIFVCSWVMIRICSLHGVKLGAGSSLYGNNEHLVGNGLPGISGLEEGSGLGNVGVKVGKGRALGCKRHPFKWCHIHCCAAGLVSSVRCDDESYWW
ncbi:hypothetical protein BN1708_015449 [Verticillium longisporum]|uniref:Uncharacterized protein n=1 Tax=Verticillium longisporum TaxID=100787 RepID=A0A0G4M489_VERLO|nr:hypothetical protein BN1708_015449 [Verticillium longisporum]